MRTYIFQPSLGERYVFKQPGSEDQYWIIKSITRPRHIADYAKVTLREEVLHTEIRLTIPQLAQKCFLGEIRPTQLQVLQPCPIAFNDLIAEMSVAQRINFQTKLHYVQALARADVGLSPKSKQFVEFIPWLYERRVEEWERRIRCAKQGEQVVAIESKCPAPDTVYRWYSNYRKAGNDYSVLAQEVIVIRTRGSRKAKAKEVAAAVIKKNKARIANSTISQITEEVNRILATDNPLELDEAIARLHAEANQIAIENKKAKSGKSSMQKKTSKKKI